MIKIVEGILSEFLKNCITKKSTPLLVILGPTAAGKTALSLEIAKAFNGEIISADSRQVYKEMNIGTDKLPEDQREGIPHHLFDVASPGERFTVADYKKLTDEKIPEIFERGKLPIMVGGTWLYIEAVIKNYAIPPDDPAVRTKLMAELEKGGKEALYSRLQKIDPASAEKIHPNNIPYLIRALEIAEITGQAKSDQKQEPKFTVLQIGIRWPREVLKERIAKRVKNQIENGLVEETRQLLGKGYSRELPSMRSLGYREIAGYLAGEYSLEEAIKLLTHHTTQFAKRQMTWWNRDKSIYWIELP